MDPNFEHQTQKPQPSKKNQLMCRITGCWTFEEQKKYVEFLSFFRKSLLSRQKRKNNRLFKHMSEYIGTRDGIQCRSHHIKQLNLYKQVRRIISHFYQSNNLDYVEQDSCNIKKQECPQLLKNLQVKSDHDNHQRYSPVSIPEQLSFEADNCNWYYLYPTVVDPCFGFLPVTMHSTSFFLLPDYNL